MNELTCDHFFRLLGDATRLRCLLLMQHHGELCVCELTNALETIQPKVSRHLATLRESGLVNDRRQGQWIYYRLHPQLTDWQQQVIRLCAESQPADSPHRQDLARLAAMHEGKAQSCNN